MSGPIVTNVSAEQQPSATSSEPNADTANMPGAKELVREAVTAIFQGLSGQPFDRLASLRGGLPINSAGIPQGTIGMSPTLPPPTSALSVPQTPTTEIGGTTSSQPKYTHSNEATNLATRATGSEPQSSSSWFTSRSTPTHQTAEASRANLKEANNSSQQRASNETKTEVAKEPKPIDPRSEVIAVDVSHKNIAQTLEAALDKVLKGTGVSVEIKQAEALKLSSTSTSQETASQTLSPATEKSSSQGAPLQPNQSQSQDPALQLSAAQSQELATKLETLRNVDQLQNQRAEQLRVIQQIIAAENDPLPTVKVVTAPFANETAANVHPRHESTTVSVEKVRESVLDKFTSIRTQIETSAVERQKSTPSASTADSLVQGRSNLTKANPIHHDAKPNLALRQNDRTSDSHSIARAIFGTSVIPLTSASYPAIQSAALGNTTDFSLHSLGNILKTLQAFSRRSTNAQLMKRMDSALERTCLTLATGAAIGFVGAEVLAKTVGLGLRELLRIMRETRGEDLKEGEPALESAVMNALEDYLVEDALEPSAQSMVADVSGILICHETQQPLANVLVGSRELGSCMTDHDGRFILSNVLVGTAYALTFYKPFFELTPNTIDGICSFDSHHKVEITLIALQGNGAM